MPIGIFRAAGGDDGGDEPEPPKSDSRHDNDILKYAGVFREARNRGDQEGQRIAGRFIRHWNANDNKRFPPKSGGKGGGGRKGR